MEDWKIKIILNKINYLDDNELKVLLKELLEERERLLNDANIDSLTGLYNRRIINNISSYSVVVMCDVDNFKKINDKYGHKTGDDVLKLVASTLKNNIRSDDIVCRYGGDEFLIVFLCCDYDIVVNRIIEIQNLIKKQSKKMNVTISAGMSLYEKNKKVEQAIEEADMYLYKSKEKRLEQAKIKKLSK